MPEGLKSGPSKPSSKKYSWGWEYEGNKKAKPIDFEKNQKRVNRQKKVMALKRMLGDVTGDVKKSIASKKRKSKNTAFTKAKKLGIDVKKFESSEGYKHRSLAKAIAKKERSNKKTEQKVRAGEKRLARTIQESKKEGEPAKKRNIPGWMQRNIDKQMDMITLMAEQNKLDEADKQKKIGEEELEEMDKLLAFISKSPAPSWVFEDYTPEEASLVGDKNIANQMEYNKALQRYNELAKKHGQPSFGKKKTDKNLVAVDLSKLDFNDPATFTVDANVEAIMTHGTPEQQAALEAALQNKTIIDDNTKKAGSDPSFIPKVIGNVIEKTSKSRKEAEDRRAVASERRSVIAKTKRAGHVWTQEEIYRYSKTGVLPEAVKKLLEKLK